MSSTTQPRPIKSLQPSYSGFLNREYANLLELWRANDMLVFWHGIVGFWEFLPADVKDNTKDLVDKVNTTADMLRMEALANASNMLEKTIAPDRVVFVFLKQIAKVILDCIMRLLDEKGYLEHGHRPLSRKDFAAMRETDIEN